MKLYISKYSVNETLHFKQYNIDKIFIGTPSRNRTHNPQIRSLILYPVELLGHTIYYN